MRAAVQVLAGALLVDEKSFGLKAAEPNVGIDRQS